MAAIGSQWRENHQLREELKTAATTKSPDVTTLTEALRKIEEQAKADREQAKADRESAKEAMEGLTARIEATKAYYLETNHMLQEFSNQVQEAKVGAATAINMRQAQSLASMYQSGAAAGVSWQGKTRDERVADVMQGRAPAQGAFQGVTFKMGFKDQPVSSDAYRYIGQDSEGDLVYDRDGKQPPKGSLVQPASLRNAPAKGSGPFLPDAPKR